ncbi:TPA: GIY-YIG nuclease family protein [Vibrio vulnificus]|nr:GIY-YIG nuclease family protein [Vibrio vulnificus]
MSQFVILADAGTHRTASGVTGDLIKRIWQHKNGESDGFTKKYRVVHLVYFEQFEAMSDAILREKQLKKWNRQWKIQLIESANPHWLDLYKNLRTTIR